jgi:hypothetical protein
MTFVRCPQCDLPAKVTDRFSFASTSGPIEHLKIVCAGGHWFTPQAADVQALPDAPPAEAAEARALRHATVRRKAA